MKILFLHGWHSVVGGVKPTFLINEGHEVINPALDDDDFDTAVRTAQAEFDLHQPDVIVGSSRGGAVAMNIDSGKTPLVLLCPAWKNWGTARTLKTNSVILHSRADDVIPFGDSVELVANSGLPTEILIEIGGDHRLADPESLRMMLNQCESLTSERSIMRFDLSRTFKTDDLARDNFLSRLFGMFNEEPVRIWGEMESSPYEYLGRPTLFPKGESGYTVLDFAFRRKSDGVCFVSEMKCELAYNNYAYLTLDSISHVERHRSEQLRSGKQSFARFLEAATSPEKFLCKVTTRKNKRIDLDFAGAILVWGRTSDQKKDVIVREFGFADVLTVEDIINDLLSSKSEQYQDLIARQRSQCEFLFSSLLGEV